MKVDEEEIELSGDVDVEVAGVGSKGICRERNVHLSSTIP